MLVVSAEPGDEVFGCGGACRKHTEDGEDVIVLVVTDGCRGISSAQTLVEARRNLESESRSAAQVLEYREPLFWGESPSGIEYGEKIVRRLAQIITEAGTKLLYAPSIQDPDPTRSTLGLIVREAVRRQTTECALACYEVEIPLQPNRLLDITGVFELKQAAMACFRSRPDGQSRSEHIAALNRMRAYQLDPMTKAAEGFVLVRSEDLSRPVPGISARSISLTGSPSDQPLVSVVIRSANRPELADALDSIATQTYRHIEVVLVDVEGSGALVADPWCGQFPLRIESTGFHLGRGAAANLGMLAARGRYAIFLDDDDWFLPDHVACLVDALLRSNNARVAYSGIECRKRNNAGEWEIVHVFNEAHDATRLLIENYLPIHAVLFERSLVKSAVRFDETLNLYEDWDFWVQLSTLSNFVHIDRITAVYRIAPTSGFGVRSVDPEIQGGLAAFFTRWRDRWTLEQVIAIAAYTKRQVAAAWAESRQYLADIQAEPSALQGNIAAQSALEQTVKDLQAVLETREKRIAYLEVATDGRLTNLSRLSAALATCQARVAKLEADDAEKSGRIQALSDALGDNQAALTKLRASLGDSTTQFMYLRSELNDERERIQGLRDLLGASEAKSGDLERALFTARDAAVSSERRRQSLTGRVCALQTSAGWALNGRLIQLEQRLPRLTRAALAVAKAAWWTVTLNWRRGLARRAMAHRILSSGLFDEAWYLQRYPDVLLCGFRPVFHWIAIGSREGRDPNPLFNSVWYLAHNPEVAANHADPLLHYTMHAAQYRSDQHPLSDSRYSETTHESLDPGAHASEHFTGKGSDAGCDPHPLFDVDWYLEQNPDVAAAGINPLVHFIKQGAIEGRNPHTLFCVSWYFEQNPEVGTAGLNPLVHFIEEGVRTGRDPHPLFRIDWYLKRNPDVAALGVNPLIHYITQGMKQGLDPHILFDGTWYLANNPDIQQAGINPFIHYVTQGWRESRNPHPLFDGTWYLEHNADVREAGIDPFRHYVQAGAFEGRDPFPLFDTDWYQSENPDILDANPLYHYLTAGAAEGRRPHPLFDSAWYLSQYTDVATSGRNPLVDYLLVGADIGRNPSPQFDTQWYRTTYPDTRHMNPLVHYVILGATEGRLPRPDVNRHERNYRESNLSASASPPPPNRPVTDWEGYWDGLLPEPESAPQRILVIDWKPPTPDRDSGSYRMHMILELLREANQAVDFIADRQAEEPSYARSLVNMGIPVIVGQEATIAHLQSHGGHYRVVWISRPELAEIYLPIARAYAVKARLIYDTVDLHWVRFERGIPFDDHPDRLAKLADRYHRIEMSNAMAADITIAITAEEKHVLLEQDPTLRVELIPNVHRLFPCVTPVSARQDLFFIGGFNHAPNVDAVLYFVRDILPLVSEQLPEIRFNIVGSDMPDKIHALESSQINPVGYVPDVTSWFEQSRVFVSPLRHGAGMKGKIGQSLSYGLPVVTSRIGAEGMGLTHEVDALIADEPAAFAEAIVRLYTDDAFWHRMSVAGQDLIERHYSKEAVASMLLPLLA